MLFCLSKSEQTKRKDTGIFSGALFRLASAGPAELAAEQLRKLRPKHHRLASMFLASLPAGSRRNAGQGQNRNGPMFCGV
jgi:hypothetical protein